MSQEAMCVKEEPEWNSCGTETTSAGLYADHEIKDELVIGAEVRKRPPAVFPDLARVKMEAEPEMEDIACYVKASPARWEPARARLVRDVAAQADLCAGHAVELVLPAPDTMPGFRGQQPGPPSAATVPVHEAALRPARPNPTRRQMRECPTCHKQFDRPSHLKRHEQIHTGKKPFTCEICKRQFYRLDNLKGHKLIHTGEKRHPCFICKKDFISFNSLKSHELTHTGEKRYSCDICKKQFAHASAFKTHERIHTGEKPYACGICEKRFADLSTMKRHRYVHTGDKPYACDLCKKGFILKSYLVTHIHTRHMRRKPSKLLQTNQ